MGKNKTFKSYDTNSEFNTGKRRSRCKFNSSYDTEDKAKEFPKVKGLQPGNDNFKTTINYCTYRLEGKSQKYDDDVARKIPKRSMRLTVQMKSHTFDAAEQKTPLSFLDSKMAYDTNGVHEGAAMWLFHLFMKKFASAILNACTCLKPRKKRRLAERILTTYCKVVNCLLSTYATDDVESDANAKMATYKQPPNVNLV